MRAAAYSFSRFHRCRGGSSNPTTTTTCPLLVFSTTKTLALSLLAPSSISSAAPQDHETLDSSSSSQQSSAELQEPPRDAGDVFRRCGCSDDEVSKILRRQPSLLRMNLPILHSKLHLLQGLGLLGPDFVKIVHCHPRFLAGRVGRDLDLDLRLDFLRTLFDCNDRLLRAIVCNPCLLNYDMDKTLRPCVQLYEDMGITRFQLGALLLSRPTIVPRSTLNDDKLELIRRTRLTKEACMYKYAVSIIAISRLETIREKVTNLEKFGFSADEVMGLFARSPNVLTLSIDKVQRNMTYIVGVMKLSARVVLDEPSLLFANLDTLLKPRYLLGGKLREMGLEPQIFGPLLIRALRMKEPRFLRAFVMCHEKDVAEALMEFYSSVKGLTPLAESSKIVVRKGFPF